MHTDKPASVRNNPGSVGIGATASRRVKGPSLTGVTAQPIQPKEGDMFGPAMHESPFGRRKSTKPRERKPRQDREHAEAVALMQLVKLHEARFPALRWLFAVPNGGWRGKPRKLRKGGTLPPTAAVKAKAEGVKTGVPDYLWPVHCVPSRIPDARIVANAVRPPAQYWVGMALELKAKGGRVEPEQREWLLHLEAQGWLCIVAYGADEAWAAIREYCDGLPAV